MPKTHRILRTVPGVEHLPPGTLIDTAGWRNVDQLVKARYLEPIAIVDGEAAPQPPAPATIGPNVKRLIANRITLDAIPPGGTVADGVEFLLSGRLGECSRRASEWVKKSIAAVKAATDNPYGDDDEAIAAYLLAEIKEMERPQAEGDDSTPASAATEPSPSSPPSDEPPSQAAGAPAARQRSRPAATTKPGN